MTKKLKDNFLLAVKLGAGLLLAYVLYSRLHAELQNFEWNQLNEKFSCMYSWLLFSGAMLLVLLNWLLEGLKWKTILDRTLMPIDFYSAFKSVLAGVAFGNLAPGRATEFAGKILFIPSEKRAAATYLHFVSGMLQLLITLITGVSAFIFLFFKEGNMFGNNIFFYAGSISFLLLGLIISFIYRPVWFYNLLRKNPKIKSYLSEKIEISEGLLARLTFYSALRYLTFSFQYLLLICIFYEDFSFPDIILGIMLYYLFTTVIPMFSIIEAFMRGGIALLIFSPIEKSSINIFIASTFLWVINIVIPSLAGYFFFLFLKNNRQN